MKTVKKLLMAVFALAVIVTAALPKEVKAGGDGTTYTLSTKTWDNGSNFTIDSTTGGVCVVCVYNDSASEISVKSNIVDKNGKAIDEPGNSTFSAGEKKGLIYIPFSYSEWETILSEQGYEVPDVIEVSLIVSFDDSTKKGVLLIKLTNVGSDSSSDSEDEKVFTDYDTYKSELPSHTVLATLSKNYSNDYKMDMKAHAPSAATAANQSLLADAFAKSYNKTKNIIWSWDIFAKRDLTLSENGGRYEININTKATGQAGTVYMECYSPEDKAYTLVGTMDDKGVATFDNFILRPATSVTIFTLK